MKTFAGTVILVAIVGGIYLLNDLTRTEDGKSILHVARDNDKTSEQVGAQRQ